MTEEVKKLVEWVEKLNYTATSIEKTLASALRSSEAQVDKGEAFKKWVHDFLDKQDVPADPDPEENARCGCRISGRMRWVFDRVERLRAEKDQAYLERNRLVAAFARMFPSGIRATNIPGWSEDWHGCVYIDTPAGQLSWHFHTSHTPLFEALPLYKKPWDGHTTEVKYERLAKLSALLNKPKAEAQEK